jgi:hypothetical protein
MDSNNTTGTEMDIENAAKFYRYACAINSFGTAPSRQTAMDAKSQTIAKFGEPDDWYDVIDADVSVNTDFMSRDAMIDASGFDAADFE